MGGAIAQLARLFPHSGYDFSDQVQPLPADGSVPGLEYWRWVHTPGHTPGHVSLFRETDGALLVGDALATMNMDWWTSQLTQKRELRRPPTPFTPDWEVAYRSVEHLADLEPSIIAAGHGLPITRRNVAEELRNFIEHFSPPHGPVRRQPGTRRRRRRQRAAAARTRSVTQRRGRSGSSGYVGSAYIAFARRRRK